MYEDQTLIYYPEIHEEYLDTSLLLPHHVQPRADYNIAINTTKQTEMQQFSAVTVSLKSNVSVILKNLKFGLLLPVAQDGKDKRPNALRLNMPYL